MLTQSKITATLTVNPAFLQEIKDCNPGLWRCVGELRQACQSGDKSRADVKRLIELIVELHEQVRLQFELEESFGFIECSDPAAHRLGDQAEAAHGQHFRLFLQLTDLYEYAEELQFRGFNDSEVTRLMEETLAFEQVLQEHESLEKELIELAYQDRRDL